MIKKKQYLKLLNTLLDTEEEVTEHFYKYTTDSLKYYKWLGEDEMEQVYKNDVVTKQTVGLKWFRADRRLLYDYFFH